MLNEHAAVLVAINADSVPVETTVEAVLVIVMLVKIVVSLNTVAVVCTTVGCTAEVTVGVPLTV